jgi:drug/metabolite transporter (DMT)-like permease
MKKLLVYVAVTCSALFWGATFNLAKVAVAYLPPFTIAGARFTIAATLMTIMMIATQREIGAALRRNWKAYLIMGLIGQVGFNICFFFGMRYTTPTNGALIMATNPLVTALMAGLLLREPLSRNHKVGTILSFLGVSAIVLSGSGTGLAGVNVGDLLVIGANVCMALYSVAGKKYQKGSTPVMTTAWTMVFAAPVLVALAALWEPNARLLGHPWEAYGSVLAIAVLGSVLAYIFWNYGLTTIGVADTAVFFHLVPVFTVVLSFILGQRVTGLQLIAGAIVIVGVAISSGALMRLTAALWPRVNVAPRV